jgi:ATP synthase protein I
VTVSDQQSDQPSVRKPPADFAAQVGVKATRKLKARRDGTPGLWLGLGMMGLIGWSVVVPTLLGAALGLWLDQAYPGGRSWTLALLMGGLSLGCINAWHWVTKEQQAMHEEQDDQHE